MFRIGQKAVCIANGQWGIISRVHFLGIPLWKKTKRLPGPKKHEVVKIVFVHESDGVQYLHLEKYEGMVGYDSRWFRHLRFGDEIAEQIENEINAPGEEAIPAEVDEDDEA